MDPAHGEISRAMRNRGIEVCILPEETLGSVNRNKEDWRSLLLSAGVDSNTAKHVLTSVAGCVVYFWHSILYTRCILFNCTQKKVWAPWGCCRVCIVAVWCPKDLWNQIGSIWRFHNYQWFVSLLGVPQTCPLKFQLFANTLMQWQCRATSLSSSKSSEATALMSMGEITK
jgi:hypothetical protein